MGVLAARRRKPRFYANSVREHAFSRKQRRLEDSSRPKKWQGWAGGQGPVLGGAVGGGANGLTRAEPLAAETWRRGSQDRAAGQAPEPGTCWCRGRFQSKVFS